MFRYFNVDPLSSSSYVDGFAYHSSYGTAMPFNKTAPEFYVSQSEKVRQSILEDRPIDNGQLITPQYDTDETIDSGSPNPFTNPRMGELDRFEYALGLGADAVTAAQLASQPEPTGMQTEATVSESASDGQ